MRPAFYKSFEEFEREEIKPGSTRVGFSIDDLIEESVFDSDSEVDLFDKLED